MVRLGANWILVGFSVLTIISYYYSFIAKRFNIPSVILLIATGIGLNQILTSFDAKVVSFSPWLEILGMTGIVLIVLEAALDIKFKKDTIPLIIQVVTSSVMLIVVTTAIISGMFHYFLHIPIHSAIVYAIPLSIMSSAIVIPSITHLSEKVRTFLMLEAAFSDVFGIVLFYTFVRIQSFDRIFPTLGYSIGKLILSIGLSVLLCLIILFIYQRLKLQGRVFLIISVLLGIYALGELMHFSPLIMILLFGLILNNRQFLLHPIFSKIGKNEGFNEVLDQFKFIISESSFLLRTIFFTVFGMSIDLSNLGEANVYVVSLLVVTVLYCIRFFNLKIFRAKNIFPELFIAPRGLITILLYLSVPDILQHEAIKPLMVFVIIAITSLVMMAALIGSGNSQLYQKTLEFKKRGYNN